MERTECRRHFSVPVCSARCWTLLLVLAVAAWLSGWALLWALGGDAFATRADYRLPFEEEERLLADARAVVAEENAAAELGDVQAFAPPA
mmetsp:Transcript_124570/g.346881  ORF Transcript_124570/g.346881 Transcript_124570/m.346881 type:complete len:90 (-) Transcript_124570:63-332(-)